MKRFLLGLAAGVLLGALGGYAAGIFTFPYLFPPPPLNETVEGRAEGDVLARGTFVHADPSDPVHYGRGAVTGYRNLLHLEDSFEVGPGPKYHVYLVPQEVVTPDTDVAAAAFVDLGRLKAFSGGQNYAIPEDVDLRDYPTVVIWCEQFGVLISPARLSYTATAG